jgi:hypothetical protein
MANIIRQLFNKGYKRSTRTRKKAHKADAKCKKHAPTPLSLSQEQSATGRKRRNTSQSKN